jgi:hypothetical protein
MPAADALLQQYQSEVSSSLAGYQRQAPARRINKRVYFTCVLPCIFLHHNIKQEQPQECICM